MRRRSLLKGAVACAAAGFGGSGLAAPLEPLTLAAGAGSFLVAGGVGREEKRITVHYYRPEGFTPRSPILLVLPGDGRNSDTYRDAWIGAAQAAGVLVAALGYPEADYDFAAYQMGGVIQDLVVRNMPRGPDGQPPSRIWLRDEDIVFRPNPRPRTWLFRDFDRIFALIARATRSERTGYDLFGHSAGGQIAHRNVIFHPHSRAERIVAANAGQYSYPDLGLPLPSGLAGLGLTERSLAAAFACRLTLLVGEKDDASETRGTLLHTPALDQFGLDRLSRGRRFFQDSADRARGLGAAFHWTLETVVNVGHDFRAMSAAAARSLYGA